MKVYGDLDFTNVGSLIQFSIKIEDSGQFPDVANILPGRITFFNKRVWIAAEITSGVVTWIPLTREINAFLYTQGDVASLWTIQHNLNTGSPIVQVYDDTGMTVIPSSITPTDSQTVEITFTTPIIGRAVILGGDYDGNSRTNEHYGYTHTQSSASSTWGINHGLGFYPIVHVFVGGVEVIPLSIVHNSIMKTTITFSAPQTGVARMV